MEVLSLVLAAVGVVYSRPWRSDLAAWREFTALLVACLVTAALAVAGLD